MEDSGKSSSKTKLLNPWMLHFQKLALELKCPLCLSLFKRPVLLPCDHLFCNSCLADSTTAGPACAVCKTKYTKKDVRHMPFVENMVAIYRSLDATFCASLFQQHSSDDLRVLEPCQTFLNSSSNNKKTDKAPWHSLDSNEVGVGKNHKSKISVHGKAEEVEMSCGGRVDSHSAGKPNLMQCSQMEIGDRVEMDVNQVMQSAPDSSPFCDSKGSDNDFSDQDSEHPFNLERLENSSLKRASTEKGNLKERMAQFRSESSASETEGLMRDLKRQKILTNGDDHIQHRTSQQNKFVDSCCALDLTSGKDPVASLRANAPDDSLPSTSICSFCQSSKTSEATGPMLHYANENSVTGDAAMLPNVIHVHRICIDWAPQVYFVDEAVQNLKEEVARGAKLKCSKCGLKGAALGCYVKSCRKTYHVPCAMDISTCRWDHEDFLLLCPGHSHVKFPSEKSRPKKQATQKQPASSHLPLPLSNPLGASQSGGKKMVFCGSALSNEEKVLLINFTSKVGARVTKFWTSDVTHVIAATDANGACSRTLKVLMAILNGRWILKMDWVKACMEVMNPVEEGPYEIGLDNQGCNGGPKAGRLRALTNVKHLDIKHLDEFPGLATEEPKLFSGLKFYFSGDYMSAYKEDLEDLVEAGGGAVLRSKDELEVKRHECEAASSNLLVVYNLDPPQGCKLGDEVSILWQRLNEAEDLAANSGCQVIGHTWILESIAACKLQSFVS
ncbi:Zinc finger, RING-type [Sesbania bispinosa]|nr:Zinc finger, RING-type [Sesbania bispinosa]